MRFIYEYGIVLVVAIVLAAACAKDTTPLDNVENDTLEFKVFSQALMANDPSNNWNTDEYGIKSLYIYAFNDSQKRPDFFQDNFISQQQGAIKSYNVKMNINGKGEKRFYIFVNPPLYIRKKLTLDCTEGELKSMSIALQQPIDNISKLPQDADGISNPIKGMGFPMGNQFTAHIHEGHLKGELILKPTANPTDGAITQIPLFRSLGKVTVTIEKKDQQQEAVYVKDLRIFNYTCNGYFLPQWDAKTQTWEPSQGIWNQQINMDLQKMTDYETKVGVDPISLIQNETLVDNNIPQNLASFYLCQNSYGKAIDVNEQSGVPDEIGNRTTKLAIRLSDGRESIVEMPYLRRNDHLKVKMVIAKKIIQVTFMPWHLSEVTPEWEDGVTPKY